MYPNLREEASCVQLLSNLLLTHHLTNFEFIYFESALIPECRQFCASLMPVTNFSRNSSSTDVWKSRRRTPCESSKGNIGRYDGSKMPFSTWNVSIAFNGSVHEVKASRKIVCPGIRTSSNPVPDISLDSTFSWMWNTVRNAIILFYSLARQSSNGFLTLNNMFLWVGKLFSVDYCKYLRNVKCILSLNKISCHAKKTQNAVLNYDRFHNNIFLINNFIEKPSYQIAKYAENHHFIEISYPGWSFKSLYVRH